MAGFGESATAVGIKGNNAIDAAVDELDRSLLFLSQSSLQAHERGNVAALRRLARRFAPWRRK